jgi:hypothetical protein
MRAKIMPRGDGLCIKARRGGNVKKLKRGKIIGEGSVEVTQPLL